MCTLGLLASAVWVLTPIQRATAQILPPLTVTRGPGAETCPDLDRLSGQVAQLGSGDKPSGSSAYSVTFTRTPTGFQASIRSSGGSARVLEDGGPDCRALEQAAAITLALLRDFDSDAVSSRPADPPSAPAKAAPKRARVVPPPRVKEKAKPAKPPVTWILSAGGAGLFGVVRPIAPALVVDAGASFGRLRGHLGALGMLPQTLRFGPGTLRESLLSGVVRGCVAATRRATIRFDLCSGAYLGGTRTEARGFSRNESASKVWFTIPIELALVHTARHYWGELGVSALIPLRSADSSIDGLGRAYHSPPIGALMSLRLGYATER